MVSRTFCIPGIFFLLSATVLLIFASISLPSLTALDIARVHIDNGTVIVGNTSNVTSRAISQLRFGIWAYCTDDSSTKTRECSTTGHGYSVTLHSSSTSKSVTIKSSWTRGLAVHPVAAAVSFIALVLSFSTHITVTLISSIVSFLAAFLTFVAFLIDISLYGWVRQQMHNLDNVTEHTNTAPGFWLTFVSFLLLLLAGFTVCCGRRRQRKTFNSPATTTDVYQSRYGKPSFWSRWRKNKV